MSATTDAYAEERSTKLTTAVVDVLGRGLEAVADEKSVDALRDNLASAVAAKAAAETELVTARAQLATLDSFAARAGQRVGACPACKKPITGSDLFGAVQCPACDQPLTDLLAPKTGAIDQRELFLFVGALSAVLGIAYLSTKK